MKHRSHRVMLCSANGARLREFHGEAASAEIAPKMLPKQHLNIRLVIDNKDKKFHADAPVLANDCRLAWKNDAKFGVFAPGSVSTSIDPPCCLTVMSWLIERPSPVPSPAGLV